VAYVIESLLHTVLASSLYNEILSGRTNFHYFWGGEFGQIESTPVNSFNYELSSRNKMLATKKIAPSDISLVVPRVNWSSGTTYDFYDDNYALYPSYSAATELDTANYFVVTSSYNVYKCLDNNGNSPSVIEPTSTSTSRFTTADNYIWKFMYNIPLSSVNKFVNNNFIPVQTSVQDAFYSSGAITSTTINNMGSGYTEISLSVVGDGTGAILTPVLVSGQLSNVIISNTGTGYTYATIVVTGDGGVVAVVTANLSVGDMSSLQSNVELLAVPGTIEKIPVLNSGSGYTVATVQITGDGTGATAIAIISLTTISKIIITNPGQGYTYADCIIVGNGSGASLRSIISPYGGHGSNAVKELCASRIMFYSTISTEKNQGFTIDNTFSQNGLIRDVRVFDSTDNFSGISGSALYVFTLTGSSYQLNDIFIDPVSKGKYQIFAISGNQVLVQNFHNVVPVINATLNNQTRAGTNSITTITSPTIDKFSGDFMYANDTLVSESTDQIITFKTSIKF